MHRGRVLGSSSLPVMAGAALAFAAASLLTQGLYEGLVVPRLPEWRSVPVRLWLLTCSPNAVAALLVTLRIRNQSTFGAAVLGGAVGRHIVVMLLAHGQRPGHLKSYAIESSALEWWTIKLFVQALLVAIAIAAAYVAIRSSRWLLRLLRR